MIKNENERPFSRTEDMQVLKVERLKRKLDVNWEDSLTLKVTFSGKDLPSAIIIYHSYYKVTPHVGLPLQCYNCRGLGHEAQNCKSKERYLICSVEHNCQGLGHEAQNCKSKERYLICGVEHNISHCNAIDVFLICGVEHNTSHCKPL